MAELASCLSIIPHMRSFDVPPKLSPAHAGLFLRRSTQGGHAIGIVFGPLPFDALDRSGELLNGASPGPGGSGAARSRPIAGAAPVSSGKAKAARLNSNDLAPSQLMSCTTAIRQEGAQRLIFPPAIALWGPHPM
jgi:hypothetical protein